MDDPEYGNPSDDPASLDSFDSGNEYLDTRSAIPPSDQQLSNNVSQNDAEGDYMSTWVESSVGSEYETYNNQYRFTF